MQWRKQLRLNLAFTLLQGITNKQTNKKGEQTTHQVCTISKLILGFNYCSYCFGMFANITSLLTSDQLFKVDFSLLKKPKANVKNKAQLPEQFHTGRVFQRRLSQQQDLGKTTVKVTSDSAENKLIKSHVLPLSCCLDFLKTRVTFLDLKIGKLLIKYSPCLKMDVRNLKIM